METGEYNRRGTDVATYVELQPTDRHRSFIDHLFILRDCGRLTDAGRNLFASPFSEIVLVRGYPQGAVSHDDGAPFWKTIYLPPRFGRRLRRSGFHGWMLGIRCPPFGLDVNDDTFAGLAGLFEPNIEGVDAFDPIVAALDDWADRLRPRLDLATRRQDARKTAAALDRVLNASGQRPTAKVTDVAASAGVVPRTLQRHFRDRTGLSPKRYAAVQRFNGAVRQIASGADSLAQIASAAGYSDQAHLTADVSQHAGLPPGRFRTLAQRQVVRDSVRFFKDPDLRKRVRLLVCDSGRSDDEATGDGF